ncbi:F11A17.16 [Arabidopsis thaliana]|uniref:INCREASED PETAL GROWTH ANISOTROPY 1-like protein 2 n=1 Tax=Arabidopsis thaliana TaxID=3702 RepID=IPGL2_ARATH|nr:hydroxyproline-rich glycoprotein family protein [Arabidopsis thaliana]AAD49768.2 F11A17.16 [Arabidopsis thaliana]AEE32271.1 hydroxyproline-rich glycoprotein family protein [Arabidopsis thaliana]|eukprot:NP_564524.1 hydroxyproline-rich glycoprotein family protein [Arabidopsis thaliana]
MSRISTTSTTPSRVRAANSHYSVISKPRAQDDNGLTGGKPKSSGYDVKNDPAKRRSILLKRAKSAEEEMAVLAPQRARSVNRPAVVEQFGCPRRPISRKSEETVMATAAAEDEKRKRMEELEEKLVVNESLIKDLQLQVLNLKTELEEARNSNVELELNNRKLSQDLVSAEAKISSLSSNDKPAKEHQNSRFKDIQRLIASKLEQPKVKKEVAVESSRLSPPSPSPSRLPPTPPLPKFLVSPASSLGKRDENSSPFAPPTPPPPPPPPPPRPLAKAARAQKSPPVSQLFQLLNKQDNSRNLSQSVNGNKSQVNSAHNSIVGEIQNRSAHLIAIKADIETKGEFINDLIQKVLTTCFSDMEDVMKFVDWLDKELATLADERAVLKHFKWPEKKADTLQEAAVEYRELKKLEKELSSYSDDPNIHYGVALKKMANLLDKSEQRIRRLVRLRGSSMRSYQDFKIPVEWMLDSGMICKIKRASIKLAKTYMNRVANELQSARNLDRESTKEALLLQGVRFAYRTHQFAGGLDPETLCALEEIKQRVPSHLRLARGNMAGNLS